MKNEQNGDFSKIQWFIIQGTYHQILMKISPLRSLNNFWTHIVSIVSIIRMLQYFEKKSLFGLWKIEKKWKCVDFATNSYPHNTIIYPKDRPPWAPQTPILSTYQSPTFLHISYVLFFWKTTQNEVFFTFWRGVLPDEFFLAEKFFHSKIDHLSFLTHFLP